MAKIPEQLNTQIRVYNLYCELIQEEKDKKEYAKTKAENIKRIKEEIKELIEQEAEENVVAQREAGE
jgi:hypothetical protein